MVGRMVIQSHTRQPQAVFETGTKTYYLSRSGLLAHQLVINDAQENRVLKQKGGMFGTDSTLILGQRQLHCRIKNTPLATFSIFDNDKELLQYRITSELVLDIQVATGEENYLLDFFLFYNVLPILQEQTTFVAFKHSQAQ
jgi:hypothetical protein